MIRLPSAHENICGVSAVIISTKTRDFIDTKSGLEFTLIRVGGSCYLEPPEGRTLGGGGVLRLQGLNP